MKQKEHISDWAVAQAEIERLQTVVRTKNTHIAKLEAEIERMAKLSRELGARLTRIDGERVFIDEIPLDWPTTEPIAPECDFLCSLAAADLCS